MNDPKLKTVTILKNGATESVTLKLTLPRMYIHVLEAQFADGSAMTVEAYDYFDCFTELRKQTPDVLWYCKGAQRSVYPSNMCRDMGAGLVAYKMVMGKQATRDDLVNIFDETRHDIVADPDEQVAFQEAWFESHRPLLKNKPRNRFYRWLRGFSPLRFRK